MAMSRASKASATAPPFHLVSSSASRATTQSQPSCVMPDSMMSKSRAAGARVTLKRFGQAWTLPQRCLRRSCPCPNFPPHQLPLSASIGCAGFVQRLAQSSAPARGIEEKQPPARPDQGMMTVRRAAHPCRTERNNTDTASSTPNVDNSAADASSTPDVAAPTSATTTPEAANDNPLPPTSATDTDATSSTP